MHPGDGNVWHLTSLIWAWKKTSTADRDGETTDIFILYYFIVSQNQLHIKLKSFALLVFSSSSNKSAPPFFFPLVFTWAPPKLSLSRCLDWSLSMKSKSLKVYKRPLCCIIMRKDLNLWNYHGSIQHCARRHHVGAFYLIVRPLIVRSCVKI